MDSPHPVHATVPAFRPLLPQDDQGLWHMLRLAAMEPSVEAVKANPLLSRYVADWGRPGDLGFGAFAGARMVGAAWLRVWPPGDKGFAAVDGDTPELAIAVAAEFRGRGIGSRLLDLLMDAAAQCHGAVSLSVRTTNAAIALYARKQFVQVEGSAVTNRVGGCSVTMVRRLCGPTGKTPPALSGTAFAASGPDPCGSRTG